ncbi:MAG: hypothetical protein HYX69_07645 [Planctomycetia bacterium]|nr:hypothetical protein [Planctomycetia bacterium]
MAAVNVPGANRNATIVIQADDAYRWEQGSHEVWILRGRCSVSQGAVSATSREAVLWIKRGEQFGQENNRVIAYMEGDVVVARGTNLSKSAQGGNSEIHDETWLGTFNSIAPISLRLPAPGPEPNPKPTVYRNALARRNATDDSQVQQAQFGAATGAPAATALPPGARRIQFFSRSRVPYQGELIPQPDRNETIINIRSGVQVLVDNLPGFGAIDVSADNLVVWTAGLSSLEGATLQADEIPLELYMEGNIVFRQGTRVIYADRMYYNVRANVGTVLNAEILSPAPNYEGLLRVRAAVVQQTGQGRFIAENAFATSSRLALPGYRIQSGRIFFQDEQAPVLDPFTGAPQVDAQTGEPLVTGERLLNSRNNLVFIGNVPVFYWPTFTTDLQDSSFFIRRARFKNDRIFGNQFFVDFDAYQMLGIDPLPGTDWTLSTDYFTKRGPAVGSAFRWQGADLFGVPGPFSGFVDGWGIRDHGLDTLGSDRKNLLPEPDRDPRGRVLARHRQYLPYNLRLTGEFGLISDRNFLEQYFEREWDQNKDYDTDLELKQFRDNMSWSVTGSVRLNDWFTQTQWLPRLDHYWIAQPLVGDRLSWYEHSSAAYANMRVAAEPTDPTEIQKFALLPWENNVKGSRLFTTQELDFPFAAGPVNFVPYALGQLAHWGEDLQGNNLDRAYGQVGLRASIPFWAANPTYESALWNVHGLAHKVVFDMDASWAEANRDMTQLPLYDPIDDDNIEAFNRRFQFNTFGAALGTNPAVPPIPARFDPRFYALRTGLGNSVTSPSPEILDDLTAVRLSLKQRWQTKRGLPGARHIIDWITFDTGATIFPQPNRDNFGQVVGLVNYDFNWHVGDRVTLVSDGLFDFFSQGPKLATVGGFLNRPPRGSLYLGFRSFNGPDIPGTLTPFNSQVIIASYSYRMSPKWVSSAGASIDLKHNNIGEQVAITRVGESFLVSAGVTVDQSKQNVGFNLLVEPRFLPRTTLGRVGGAQIPIAGQHGLE